MRSLKKILGGSVLGAFLPYVAAAAGVTAVDSLLDRIKGTLNTVITILFVLVTLYFIWGVVKYVSAAGDEAKLKAGKQHMIWGIIGMAVMAGAWGIVNLIVNYLVGSSGGIKPTMPQF